MKDDPQTAQDGEPTPSAPALREKLAGNPRFKRAPQSGQGVIITGAKPPTKFGGSLPRSVRRLKSRRRRSP
jgi:hypothetical protein